MHRRLFGGLDAAGTGLHLISRVPEHLRPNPSLLLRVACPHCVARVITASLGWVACAPTRVPDGFLLRLCSGRCCCSGPLLPPTPAFGLFWTSSPHGAGRRWLVGRCCHLAGRRGSSAFGPLRRVVLCAGGRCPAVREQRVRWGWQLRTAREGRRHPSGSAAPPLLGSPPTALVCSPWSGIAECAVSQPKRTADTPAPI